MKLSQEQTQYKCTKKRTSNYEEGSANRDFALGYTARREIILKVALATILEEFLSLVTIF